MVTSPNDHTAGAYGGKAPAGGRTHCLLTEIDELALGQIQKTYLRDRWVGQLDYLGKAARAAQRNYYALRLIAILGGVTIPALVGLNVGNEAEPVIRWLTFFLGLTVAASVAIEEFFRYGDRWRHYRLQSEVLLGEGWGFLELAGPAYRRFTSHADAFRPFVSRVEETMRQETSVFIRDVARALDDQREDRRDGAGTGDPRAAEPVRNRS
jgi:hypothetical protein